MRRTKKLLASLVIAGALAGIPIASVSAGHCVDAQDPTTPGFSYFGTDHVQESDHAEGNDPGHAGTPGASNCRNGATGTDPSERAPGRNK